MAEKNEEKKVEKKPEEEAKTKEEKEETKKEEEPTEEKPVEETKPEEKKEEPKPAPKPALTGKYKELIKQIESLTLPDLAELVKELEERFGVSVPTFQGVGTPTPQVVGAASGTPSTPASEKVKFTVILSSSGTNKIAVIKAIREVKPDLGLKEAKDFVESTPKTVLENVPKEDAQKAKEKLEGAGATVELK